MAPNLIGASALFLDEATRSGESPIKQQHQVVRPKRTPQGPQYSWNIVWRNVLGMLYMHIFSFYGLYLLFCVCKWKTFFWSLFLTIFGAQGVTAGAHRLWAHRCYKAKLPLRILLAFAQTIAFQNDLYEWVRDHRVHHKFTDTDADPHNAQRGFFFSHVGWLLVRKHKDIMTKGKTVDMSDMLADPVVRFQKKYYLLLTPICCLLVPMLVPCYYWNEKLYISWYVTTILRYTLSLNGTWLVNSAAHIFGTKPYDKNIGPTENKFVAAIAFGEGWHNYHHIFPWDYKASELGYKLNVTTSIIDFFAWMGWAYDLKTVSRDMIERRSKRTGDGTRSPTQSEELLEDDQRREGHGIAGGIWGWGDGDMTAEDLNAAEVHNRQLL
ncbi:PREDICTED: (11Z)-hexadec-11-enoyl-CoA conjugase-like [Nicrophorus vespilloides]|uniref:(11Z)-hexadec-11-enoyl-CoA conjugase-like n=1 Tax=Nicrophorus vespilloides TaxID=110193 RepID=A0ABM1N258_NICVS|nr:PREDICTED: (11Z)-hexadec-11-enoyl-CoA conjugase-like [Nicrophorus vespilloides]